MQLNTLSPFGAVADDVAMATLSDREVEELRQALTAEGFLVIRQQDQLTDDQFVRFLSRLGELTFTVGEQPLAHQPELNKVTNVGRTRKPRSVFHTDTSYVERPPAFTALRALTVPEAGGETLICNQYLAYEELPDSSKAELRGKRLRHRATGVTLGSDDEHSCWHPLLRAHPETGRTALYLSTPERCDRIEGLSDERSAAFIARLYAHATEERFTHRHRWSTGDVLIWDNRCTLHRADHSNVVGDRTLHRGMVLGEAPQAA